MVKTILCMLVLASSASAFAKTDVFTEVNARGATIIMINGKDAKALYESLVDARIAYKGGAKVKKNGILTCAQDGIFVRDDSNGNSTVVQHQSQDYGCRITLNGQGAGYPAMDVAKDFVKYQ